jgi:hypothetical protein
VKSASQYNCISPVNLLVIPKENWGLKIDQGMVMLDVTGCISNRAKDAGSAQSKRGDDHGQFL